MNDLTNWLIDWFCLLLASAVEYHVHLFPYKIKNEDIFYTETYEKYSIS